MMRIAGVQMDVTLGDVPGNLQRMIERVRIARANGAELILKDLIDWEAIESCAREVEGKDVPSIEEVRQRLAKISGSMAQVVIEERDERF